MSKVHRTVLLSKDAFLELIEALKPEERIIEPRPESPYAGGSMALILATPTPEGPKLLAFMRKPE